MNFLYIMGLLSTLLTYPTQVNSQNSIKNKKTEQFLVKSKCDLAKNTIEKAGNQKNIALVNYDASSQTATITYNENKTSTSEILKKIALAGFDNAEYMAPDEAYAKLDKECQYPRDKKMVMNHQEMNHSHHNKTESSQQQNQLTPFFDSYFSLKDAFVKANDSDVSKQITVFSKALAAVEMGKLSHDAHMVWMEILKDLETTSHQLSQEKNIEKQRVIFSKLSEPMYKLAQKAHLGYTVYYQTCPMFNGGSNWLSKDESIKNPFYGNKMLTCGSTIETINK
ncbi:DUF3347 domain-containing protein [Flavobacterium sp. xlx-214]|uniref:DUF3347 domain-containing protein n=1 Tax=unclassified Flavobacterium TaxID=196869 RepID=UPI0013D1881A|nr:MULTISPECIES: DUF3347 domain-containing protein [unclassified Flavobacterium]MBA5792097.1 DUF3347 domain-containing protein [Flavobacterium sp. xlx-221]QMI84344.1 DUF3347 domain-containing protein [Flavobacterium sp. xlx-214]